MFTAVSLLAVALTVRPAVDQPAPSHPQKPIAVQVGAQESGRRNGLLDLLLPDLDAGARAADQGLRGTLMGVPWMTMALNEADVAVAVKYTHRWQSSRNVSKDGSQVTLTFRYQVTAAIATKGDRDTLEAEKQVSKSYSVRASRTEPSESEDRMAFRDAGGELAAKVREWILLRLGALRPKGPDAGLSHKAKFTWIFKGDGLEVTAVVPGSPAERAGLEVGDRIRAIGKERGTKEMNELVYLWRLEAAGTRVSLEVERDKRRRPVDLELTAPPARPGPRRDSTPPKRPPRF